jgi:hypothetical protein
MLAQLAASVHFPSLYGGTRTDVIWVGAAR